MLDAATGDELNDWYHHLYGEVEDGWLSFFAVDRRTGENQVRWCKATDIDAATDITRELNAHGDVWNGVAIRTHRTSGRGGSDVCGWITALWSDIDFVDAGHAGNSLLPPDEKAAADLVRDFPVRPTAVIHSGGGLQAWHLLDEPAHVDDLGDLLEAYGATWHKVGKDAGYHVDNVFDLARIMRAPGTTNRKIDTPRPVRLIFADWARRYGISELRDHLEDPPEPETYTSDRLARDVPYIGPDRPGDEYMARHDGHEILAAYGFHSPDRDGYGNVHYRAPHRGPKDQTGATVYAEDGHVTIWSETFCARHPKLKAQHGYDVYGLYVALEHGGDFSAATSALRAKGYGAAPAPLPDFLPPPPRVDAVTGEIVTLDEPERPQVAVYWSDDETDAPEPIDELVTNLLGRGELTVLGAPRAMGKTWATMQLAGLCDAGAGRMFGSPLLEVTQPATVVYLQGELGRSGSYQRWRLATNGRPPHVAEVFERLRVRVTTTRTTQTVDGITTADEYSHAIVDHRLEPLLTELGCDLLILDPWATYYSGNENSNDETEAAIDALTQMVRRVDCAGWIVHHITAKATHGNLAEPEDLWRGASRLADAVATRVTMLPHYTPAKAKELGMDRFAARRFGDVHVLQRNGPPVPVINTQLETFRWGPWDPPDVDGGRPTEFHQKDLLDALRDVGGSVESKRKLLAVTGKSHSAVDRVLGQVIHMGLVEEFPGPRNSVGYRLTSEPTP